MSTTNPDGATSAKAKAMYAAECESRGAPPVGQTGSERRVHDLQCDEYHQHEAPKCCSQSCWCRGATREPSDIVKRVRALRTPSAPVVPERPALSAEIRARWLARFSAGDTLSHDDIEGLQHIAARWLRAGRQDAAPCPQCGRTALHSLRECEYLLRVAGQRDEARCAIEGCERKGEAYSPAGNWCCRECATEAFQAWVIIEAGQRDEDAEWVDAIWLGGFRAGETLTQDDVKRLCKIGDAARLRSVAPAAEPTCSLCGNNLILGRASQPVAVAPAAERRADELMLESVCRSIHDSYSSGRDHSDTMARTYEMEEEWVRNLFARAVGVAVAETAERERLEQIRARAQRGNASGFAFTALEEIEAICVAALAAPAPQPEPEQ